MFSFRNALVLGAALLAAAPAVQAQMSPELTMETYNNNISAITNGIINKDMLEKSRRNYDARGGSKGSSSRGTATRPAAASSASFNYVPTAALRQQTVQTLADKVKASNPDAAQKITTALGSEKSNYHDMFAEMVKPSGLPANNAATAFAAYLEAGYMVVHNIQDEKAITPAMDKGLQQQAAGILAGNKALASPAAVAQFGEEMKLETVVLGVGWLNARKGTGAEQFRTGIAQKFSKMGLDLSALRLTEQGLVKK